MKVLRILAALTLVTSGAACSSGSASSAVGDNDISPVVFFGYPHDGVYDLVAIDGDTLPLRDTTDTGLPMVITRTWMQLTAYGSVEWYQYAEIYDGADTIQTRTEQDGEWVRGSKPQTGSVIWGWVRFYVDGELAETLNDPDSSEYRVTSQGIEFVTSGSVYRRR